MLGSLSSAPSIKGILEFVIIGSPPALSAVRRLRRALLCLCTIHPPSMEMFAEWGIIDDVLEKGLKVPSLQYWERDSRTMVASFSYDLIADDTPFPFRLQCPQNVITAIAKAKLEVHML